MNYLPFVGFWFYGGINTTERANFFASWGLIESAPNAAPVDTSWISVWWHRLSPQLLINKIFPSRKFRLHRGR